MAVIGNRLIESSVTLQCYPFLNEVREVGREVVRVFI